MINKFDGTTLFGLNFLVNKAFIDISFLFSLESSINLICFFLKGLKSSFLSQILSVFYLSFPSVSLLLYNLHIFIVPIDTSRDGIIV